MTQKAALLIEFEVQDPNMFELLVHGIKSALRTVIEPPPHGGVTAWFGEDAARVVDAINNEFED